MTAISKTQAPFVPVVTRDQLQSPKVVSNDPSQNIKADGSLISIKGKGSNNGIVASNISLSFGGHTVTVGVSAGQTPQQTQDAIAKALPAGYVLAPVPTFAPSDSALFQIVKKGQVDVSASFQKAREANGSAGSDVSKSELQKIVKELKKDGFTDQEKSDLAHGYAGLFDGARFHSTEAAQKEFARLQAKFDLPVVYVR